LRGNNVASKVIKFYSEIVALEFIRGVLGPLIQAITSNDYNIKDYEVDPVRVPGEDLGKNQANLKTLCSSFLTRICESSSETPM
jgi:hypothetical protein